MTMKYKVVLQHEPEGITVSCPGLPGCISEGDTEQEALENIRSAISEYLSVVADMTREADVREVEVAV
jgi:predicted RNase H-like HicB family nuclease